MFFFEIAQKELLSNAEIYASKNEFHAPQDNRKRGDMRVALPSSMFQLRWKNFYYC